MQRSSELTPEPPISARLVFPLEGKSTGIASLGSYASYKILNTCSYALSASRGTDGVVRRRCVTFSMSTFRSLRKKGNRRRSCVKITIAKWSHRLSGSLVLAVLPVHFRTTNMHPSISQHELAVPMIESSTSGRRLSEHWCNAADHFFCISNVSPHELFCRSILNTFKSPLIAY